jgi:hypothetical protein
LACWCFVAPSHQISIHPKTFSVTSPAQRGNIARNHLARLMSRLKLVPPAPLSPAASLPKRLPSADGALAWDPVLSPAKQRFETEVTESYKLDRSMWLWMEHVSRDGGLWDACKVFGESWMEPNDDKFVTPEPTIPKGFQYNVHGLLSAIEANHKACQITMWDEAEMDRQITSGLRAVRLLRSKGDDSELDDDSDGDSDDDDRMPERDSDRDSSDNLVESELLYGGEAGKRMYERVSLAAASVQLQPVDRPGSEGWETLTPYGVQHPLRDYQKKVCSSVCGDGSWRR